MRGLGTLFWSTVLGGSVLAMVVGFAGGRSIGNAAVRRLHPKPVTLPARPAVRVLARALSGAHSLDAAEDDRDRYDAARDPVAHRPRGWAPHGFDAQRERARVAIVVIDAGIAGMPAHAFLTSPIPFTLVVPAGADDGGIAPSAPANGKHVLVDADASAAGAVAAACRRGAVGAIGSERAVGELNALRGACGLIVDTLLQDDAAFYETARRFHEPALSRDVIVDGRDGGPLLDAMFASALDRAMRTGVAVIVIHARPHSLDAAERFAVRAQRDGVDIVPIDALLAAA